MQDGPLVLGVPECLPIVIGFVLCMPTGCTHVCAACALQEYLQDYADPDLRKKGEELIAREMSPAASDPLSDQVRALPRGGHAAAGQAEGLGWLRASTAHSSWQVWLVRMPPLCGAAANSGGGTHGGMRLCGRSSARHGCQPMVVWAYVCFCIKLFHPDYCVCLSVCAMVPLLQALRRLTRKMDQVKGGEHDIYI